MKKWATWTFVFVGAIVLGACVSRGGVYEGLKTRERVTNPTEAARGAGEPEITYGQYDAERKRRLTRDDAADASANAP